MQHVYFVYMSNLSAYFLHSLNVVSIEIFYLQRARLVVSLHNTPFGITWKIKELLLNYTFILAVSSASNYIFSIVTVQLIFSISFHTHRFLFPCETIVWHFEEIFLVLGNKTKTTHWKLVQYFKGKWVYTWIT